MSHLAHKYEVITVRPRVTSTELKCWLDLHGLRRQDLAIALGVSPTTITTWCTGRFRTPRGLHDELVRRYGRPYPPNDNDWADD